MVVRARQTRIRRQHTRAQLVWDRGAGDLDQTGQAALVWDGAPGVQAAEHVEHCDWCNLPLVQCGFAGHAGVHCEELGSQHGRTHLDAMGLAVGRGIERSRLFLWCHGPLVAFTLGSGFVSSHACFLSIDMLCNRDSGSCGGAVRIMAGMII